MAECATGDKQKREYVYKSTLRTRYGLTPKMIDELGGPDEWCDNPHYRNGPSASLYLVERVEAWVRVNAERLAKAKEQRERRSAAGKAAYERGRAVRLREGQEWVNGLTIEVQRPLPATLLSDVHKLNPMTLHPGAITTKALHAYVRGKLTNYDDLRRQFWYHEFEDELNELLRERFNAAITEAVLDWRRQHPDGGAASLFPTWEHFIRRLMVVGPPDDRRKQRLSTRVPRVADLAGDKPLTSDRAAMLWEVGEGMVAVLRRIEWRGRRLIKKACKNRAGVWRVAPDVVSDMVGLVPDFTSTYGPRLVDALDFLTSGAAPDVALPRRAPMSDMAAWLAC